MTPAPGPEWIDSHAHLDAPRLRSQLPRLLRRAAEAGVRRVVTIGVTPSSSRSCLELASQWPNQVYATAGYHPHWANGTTAERLAEMKQVAAHPDTVAVGEIGLDYRRMRSPMRDQLHLFDTMLSLAAETGLPIVVHDGQAHADVLERISAHRACLSGGIIHCFSGDWQLAKKYLDWGFYLAFSGTVTYPRNRHTREVATRMPAERLLLETDAPHLTPAPLRGRRNEPANVVHTAAAVAELRRSDPAELAAQTTENVVRALRLPVADRERKSPQ